MTFHIRRTMLMTPANRRDRLSKTLQYAADSVIFDLEDSIPSQEKENARQTLCAFLQEAQSTSKEVCVRINGMETNAGHSDLKQIPWNLVDSIMLPKIESTTSILQTEKILQEICQLKGRNGALQLIVTLETPRGILNALKIADASENISAIFFGSGDYTSALNAHVTNDVLHFPRSVVCAVAAAKGIQAIDAAYFLQVKDAQATLEDARIAREHGFCGKVVFHPNQINVVHQAFTPTNEEIQSAQKLVQAYEEASEQGIGTFIFDGKFVAVDLVKPAKRKLQIARHLIRSQEAQ